MSSLPPININTSPRPAEVSSTPTRGRYHTDVVIPGITLDDYTRRVPDEEGLYVLVTQHKEWLEEIKQPPTPQEIAQKKADERAALKVLGWVAASVVGVFGALIYLDGKKNAPLELETPATE